MLLCRGAARGQVGPVFMGGPWVFDGRGAKVLLAKVAFGGPLLANSRARLVLGMARRLDGG